MNFAHFLFWLPLGIIAIGLIAFARHARGSAAATSRPIPLAARLAETVALAGLSIAILTTLLVYHTQTNVVPVGIQPDYGTTAVVLAIITAAWLLLAWFRHTICACFALTIFFYVVMVTGNNWVLGHKRLFHNDELQSNPLEITLNDNIPGADVWFNDIYLGKTPIHITSDEFCEKIPDSKNGSKKPEWYRQNKSYVDVAGQSHQPYVMRVFAFPYGDIGKTENRTVFVRVELDGQVMYDVGLGYTAENYRELVQYGSTGHIRLNMLLPHWEDEVHQLIQHARLNDYKIDDAWIAAAETYENRVWRVMRHESLTEPALNQTLDAWATQRYKLDGVRGPDSARDVVDFIVAEAEKRGYYCTDTPAGRAIELIVPYLKAEGFVDRAEERIDSFRARPCWNVQHGMIDGRPFLSTSPLKPEAGRFLAPGDTVLAHLIWKLDERFDREDDLHDNLIEQRLTPALLRLNPHQYNQNVDAIAGFLGGHAYDQFVVRHDWRKENLNNFYDGMMIIGGPTINRWLFTAASLDSETGRTFRKKHKSDVLQMAEQIINDTQTHYWPQFTPLLDFLFLDKQVEDLNYERSPYLSLAVRFWPTFDRIGPGNRPDEWEGAEIRWTYLSRLQPSCKPEAFVEVYRRYADQRIFQGGFDLSSLRTLEPAFQFDVLDALLAEAEKLFALKKPNDPNYSIQQANTDDFRQLKLCVPSEKSATALLDWLTEETDDDPFEHSRRVEQAQRFAENDRLSIFHLERLAASEDPELRKLVLTPIEKRPTPERCELLRNLLEDPEDTVRAEAEKLNNQLKTLREQPLPTRHVSSITTKSV